MIDGFSGNLRITGEQISARDLPDVAHGKVSEELPLNAGVRELEDLVPNAGRGEPIRLGVPEGPSLRGS